MPSRTTALIVAAGQGSRAGEGLPKQYRRIAGKAVLAHAIDALAAHPAIGSVQVIIGEGQEALYRDAIGDRSLPPVRFGGLRRRDSVANGLAGIASDRVLIHDAARPFCPPAVIDRLLAALDRASGAVPVLPVADTLVEAGAVLGATVRREALSRVQTPQAFHLPALLAGHAAWDAGREASDDAQMVRAAGYDVVTVEGAVALDKLTVAEDFTAAERRFERSLVTRTALGFDVHRFCEGNGLWLGGVFVAHSQGLAGHSDADAALHALTDALLGTIGAGDIGTHFPPSDPQWAGAASHLFLAHARDLVCAAGGGIEHVDLTIICEAPKVGPYRALIRSRIAEILRIEEASVSVKATTTEGLGFTGRREGIAAQAAATVGLPRR